MKTNRKLNQVVGVILISRVFIPPIGFLILVWIVIDLYRNMMNSFRHSADQLRNALQPISDAFSTIRNALDKMDVLDVIPSIPGFDATLVTNLINSPLNALNERLNSWFWILWIVLLITGVYLILNYLAQSYEQVLRGMELIRSGSRSGGRRRRSRSLSKPMRILRAVHHQIARYVHKTLAQYSGKKRHISAAIAPPRKTRRR